MKALHSILIFLGLLSLILIGLSGPLYQLEWLTLGGAFTLLRWAVYLAIGAGILNIIALFVRRPKGARAGLSVLAIIAAFIAFYLPYTQYQTATSVPPIHDISTDTVNPPEFVAIAPLRANAPNPVEYAGEETAKQQKEAYPDITTYVSPKSPDELYQQALTVAKNMGWEIIDTSDEQHRIEATATTTWFGFKDDVVIRIQAQSDETLLDIRSKSRVGRSDVGKNAERIRSFLSQL